MDEDKSKNFLGIDWGSVKVGIALGHAETRLALAYATLENNKELLLRLGEIIAAEHIGTVVIGIPSYINREEVEYEGEKLGRLLEQRFLVSVEYQNEMFTTKMAQANLIERGEKGVSSHDDEEAARIILQEWLERKDIR
ncbi:MAG: Holliday junction resolvase RuvX [Candidatus Moranbacteria bacterium]|nr:Holliday junction resolvase RuvX [Candidatus Moranbacteria bacterium]